MSKKAMKLTQMMDALIQKYSDKLYDGTGAKAANDFELDVAAIRLTLAEQPAQVEVCCGDYEKCMKPCTPRGKWLAEQPAPVPSAMDEMWIALASYQPQATAKGHGETWAAMCKEKTADAVNAAWSASAYAAYYDASDDAAAAYAAAAAADDSIMDAQRAIDYINKAKENT